MLINLRENWLIKNPAKAFSAAAGVFVMAALIFYLFYQGGYYYKNDLLKYLPASTAAFIQVKQPLFIQKETDAKLDGLYRPLEQINFFMGFGDNFNTNFFSRPPNEFIYFLYDSDEGLKKAYIAKTNNKNFRVANLVNHNYFWLDKNILLICPDGCDDNLLSGINNNIFKKSGYDYIYLYSRSQYLPDVINQFVGELKMENTKFIQRFSHAISQSGIDEIFFSANPSHGVWRFNLSVSPPDLNYFEEKNQLAEKNNFENLDSMILPNDYVFYLRQTETDYILENYLPALLDSKYLLPDFQINLSSAISSKIDLIILQPKANSAVTRHQESEIISGPPEFVLSAAIEENFELDKFKDGLAIFLSFCFPDVVQTSLPDESLLKEIKAVPDNINFFQLSFGDDIWVAEKNSQIVFFVAKDRMLYLSNSLEILTAYLAIAENLVSEINKAAEKCLLVFPQQLIVFKNIYDSNNKNFLFGDQTSLMIINNNTAGGPDGCLILADK